MPGQSNRPIAETSNNGSLPNLNGDIIFSIMGATTKKALFYFATKLIILGYSEMKQKKIVSTAIF